MASRQFWGELFEYSSKAIFVAHQDNLGVAPGQLPLRLGTVGVISCLCFWRARCELGRCGPLIRRDAVCVISCLCFCCDRCELGRRGPAAHPQAGLVDQDAAHRWRAGERPNLRFRWQIHRRRSPHQKVSSMRVWPQTYDEYLTLNTQCIWMGESISMRFCPQTYDEYLALDTPECGVWFLSVECWVCDLSLGPGTHT